MWDKKIRSERAGQRTGSNYPGGEGGGGSPLQGVLPPSGLQSLIRSNHHRRETLQSGLISQNAALVMGNK